MRMLLDPASYGEPYLSVAPPQTAHKFPKHLRRREKQRVRFQFNHLFMINHITGAHGGSLVRFRSTLTNIFSTGQPALRRGMERGGGVQFISTDGTS